MAIRIAFFLLWGVFSLRFVCGSLQEYTEPNNVATTEGLPSSLINQSVCVISGEYTDAILDIIIPGPEPLAISRVYTSFSGSMPWTFNHYEHLILGSVIYADSPSYIIALRQSSGSQLDYVFNKKDNSKYPKKMPFKLVVPKGLTNGASVLSGKTNLRNQTIEYHPDKDIVIAKTGAGDQKIYKKNDLRLDGWPICGQVSEEKINGARIKYKGEEKGISGAEEIICENKKNKKRYSSILFSEKRLEKEIILQTLTTSDGRELFYYFKHHQYKIKEKGKNNEHSFHVDRFYLNKVDHSFAPPEKYQYGKKALSEDLHITSKLRDHGRRFLNIEYYHQGVNHVG